MTKYRIDLDCDKIADLYLSGKSAAEIGTIFGVSKKPILLRLRESDVKIRSGREIKDIAGKRFGRLVVLHLEEKRKGGQIAWLCQCDCGNTINVMAGSLHSGNTRSCGCLQSELTSERFTKRRGPKNPNWNPGLTNEDRKINRNYPGYKEWRKTVYERDKYACQYCGDKIGSNLIAHHVESYRDNPKLRTTLKNGITLCEDCHNDFHHIYGRGNNTREQFEQFLSEGKELSKWPLAPIR